MTGVGPRGPTVVVVEDHPLFRVALVEALAQHPEIELVGEAADGDDGLRQIREVRPDVALVDLRMPRLSGVELLREVRRGALDTRVLILSAELDGAMRSALEDAGAAGCLPKSAGAEEIADAVVAAARGRPLRSDTTEPPPAPIPPGAEELRPLSERELEILRLVAEGDSAPQIAGRLYLSPTTVSTHLRNIYRKLDVPDRAAAVAKALRGGLLR